MKKVCVIFLTVVLLWGCSDSNPANNNPIEKPPFESEEECLAQHFWYLETIEDKVLIDTLLLPNKILIGFELITPDSEIVKFINNNPVFENIDESKIRFISNEYWGIHFRLLIAKTETNKTCSEIAGIIKTLKTNPTVLFANYTYQSGLWFGGIYYDVMSYTDEILVKVFDENDLTDLNEVVAQTNTVVKRQNEFMKDWFTITVTKNSKYDALKMAQYFFETGKFIYSNPNMWDFIDKD